MLEQSASAEYHGLCVQDSNIFTAPLGTGSIFADKVPFSQQPIRIAGLYGLFPGRKAAEVGLTLRSTPLCRYPALMETHLLSRNPQK